MLLKLFLMFIFGAVPVSAAAETPLTPQEIHNAKEGTRFSAILRLEKAEPDFVEGFCEQIKEGNADLETLTKAFPGMIRTMESIDYSQSDRTRIRDAIKGVYFHLVSKLERNAQEDLTNVIMRIANM